MVITMMINEILIAVCLFVLIHTPRLKQFPQIRVRLSGYVLPALRTPFGF